MGAGDGDLAAMAAQGVDFLGKGGGRAHGSIGGQGARDDGAVQGALGPEQTRERQCGRDLGAIDEGQPLLGGERDGRKSGAR